MALTSFGDIIIAPEKSFLFTFRAWTRAGAGYNGTLDVCGSCCIIKLAQKNFDACGGKAK